MARADSLAKLAFAYGLHLTRRRLARPRSQLAKLLETYAPDGIRPLLPEERERHPHLIGCINCGLCALAAGRVGKVRLPELASSYMRLYARLGEAASDVEGESPDIEAAASPEAPMPSSSSGSPIPIGRVRTSCAKKQRPFSSSTMQAPTQSKLFLPPRPR